MEDAKSSDIIINGFIERNEFYGLVDCKLKKIGITRYPIHSMELIEMCMPSITVVIQKFDSNNICGILYKGKVKSRICLNSLRDDKGKNFDCMHELMHYWFHPPADRWCIYDRHIPQNKGMEWQANEGAAQALMPKDLFIDRYFYFEGNMDKLSEYFFVGKHAVEYRIKNLKRDIAIAYTKYKPKKTKEQLLKEFFEIANKAIF